MADIALTASAVTPVYPQQAKTVSVRLAAAVTQGQILYQLTAGTFGVADANDAGKQQARGVALAAGGAGAVIDMLVEGHCYGFTVSSLNADAVLYLSDTAGALADAAGTLTVNCGRVTAIPTAGTSTKVVYFSFDWLRTWA